jgi:nicotinate-nucleotide adenylyltransferase
VVMIGLFGGTFDPPHVGHVALAHAAKEHFRLPRLTILVAEHPGHKQALLPAAERLALARAAFPDDEVRLDPYARTIDLLRGERFDDPIFLVGADQFAGFLSWKEPDAVLERTRIGVATRPGHSPEQLDDVLAELERPERVAFFDLEPNPAASRDIRALIEAGAPLAGLVPEGVADLIRSAGLYVRDTGLH